ncbi:aminomethyl-transferring glycine dehydrogenase subunit GcvPB [Bythopirellula goksoeyrii]|uniref:Probable glycine dehydrogenase (decarboxylating) subunit 2 n=1 Tax=Bythopirellula goksoeyrii TaxID=1400387 RepID=A0A5B9QDG1_9BACT|nr:aminomethyl-transferring glycine dehydrogenase subunit GcvPB [Bythopirellula goksoeyrii]QEG37107.1 putative glycine dehydrogenase (decarboxylating) subunit 2 [Bythopirellula goksoeyrii]
MRNNRDTQLLCELSKPGRRAARLPACDVPEREIADLLPAESIAPKPPALPEVTEPQIVRHFVNLSTMNMSVDTHFYPLGSCTMKYNPKRNERAAAMPGFADLHPCQPEQSIQGMLALLYEMQEYFKEISGLDACSLQPAAGAHGELTALLVAAAYFRDNGEKRTKVLVPDNAHGTNPASAAMAGYKSITVKTTSDGFVDMADLAAKLDDEVAVMMITNPSTLGLFEPHMREIADQVHARGGLIYLDGANMNAILGITRPGDWGADMQHYNPHKTFSGPHGGGGPGAGPICVTDKLAPYLPTPIVRKGGSGGSSVENRKGTGKLNPSLNAQHSTLNSHYSLDFDMPKTIGRVRSFFGNVGVLVRAYAYIRTHGPDGLRAVSENAVLNANYLLSRVKHILPVPQGNRCMHEFVASANTLKKEKGITAMDIAKRLLDYGFHAPTVYFPLTVPEAMMCEPTESESKESLDAFAEVLFRITEEDADLLHDAPHTTSVSRPDEVRAARQPVLTWAALVEAN